MRLEDYDTSRRFPATVEASTRLTAEGNGEEIRELELSLPVALDAEVGQSVGLILEGPFDAPGEAVKLGHRRHFRLYTIADLPEANRIRICVMRCGYVDDYSGEAYPGIASSRLCDARVGEQFTLSGPFGLPWTLPDDESADLVFIGAGTGVAPFRALTRRMVRDRGSWAGHVWLLQFARTRPDLFYTDELRGLLEGLTGPDGFQITTAVSPRPHFGEAPGLEQALQAWPRLGDVVGSETGTLYVAGYSGLLARLDDAIAAMLGDADWPGTKAALQDAGRWQELIY
ncbi:MAG: hypothetical protein V2J24_17590 [Pseudomonadales bacterium]|jgi:ferredoxin--NADP+ reductase|nr:hypothetical protein [Pseudomonadales bacterium]